MDGNVQCLSSTSAGSNHGSIEPAATRTGLAGGSVASRFTKRLFDLRSAYGFAKRHPSPGVVQEVVANRRGLRTAAVIAVAFGMIASDASFALKRDGVRLNRFGIERSRYRGVNGEVA